MGFQCPACPYPGREPYRTCRFWVSLSLSGDSSQVPHMLPSPQMQKGPPQVPWKEQSFFMVAATKSKALASFAGFPLTPRCLWNTCAICELCLQVCYTKKSPSTESLMLEKTSNLWHKPISLCSLSQRSSRAELGEGKEAFPCWCAPRIQRCFGRDRPFKPAFTALINITVCSDMFMVVFFSQIQKLGCNKYQHFKKPVILAQYLLLTQPMIHPASPAVSSTV